MPFLEANLITIHKVNDAKTKTILCGIICAASAYLFHLKIYKNFYSEKLIDLLLSKINTARFLLNSIILRLEGDGKVKVFKINYQSTTNILQIQ